MIKQSSKMDSKIYLSAPHMSGDELEFINEAFKSNWIAPIGPNVNGFESDLENYLKFNSHVTALSSGTASIHLALVMLNVGRNDEVICQTKTFVASVNPVAYLGAKPIFIDSAMDTWNMCPELLQEAIEERIKLGKKPKAIIAINLYGMPYNVNRIHDIAQQYGIPVIEDSAEALGSSYKKQPCGTFGDFSILSFNGNKIITTSGGGALISRCAQDKKRIAFLATQAKESGLDYNHKTIGYNYRMSNILAGIGRGQMKVIESRIKSRRSIFNHYKENFKNIDSIKFLDEPKDYYSNRWLTCILLESEIMRNNLVDLLSKNNIESRPSWKPMHLQELYKSYPAYLNGVSEEIHRKGLCLPSGSGLTTENLNRITSIIKSYFG